MKRLIRASDWSFDHYPSVTVACRHAVEDIADFIYSQHSDRFEDLGVDEDEFKDSVTRNGNVRDAQRLLRQAVIDVVKQELYIENDILESKSIRNKTIVKGSLSGSYPYYQSFGDPDPTGDLEGRVRYLDRFKSWQDVYNEFVNISDKYLGDLDKVEFEIEKLYRNYAGDLNFEKAYRKWCEEVEEAKESENQ